MNNWLRFSHSELFNFILKENNGIAGKSPVPVLFCQEKPDLAAPFYEFS